MRYRALKVVADGLDLNSSVYKSSLQCITLCCLPRLTHLLFQQSSSNSKASNRGKDSLLSPFQVSFVFSREIRNVMAWDGLYCSICRRMESLEFYSGIFGRMESTQGV